MFFYSFLNIFIEYFVFKKVVCFKQLFFSPPLFTKDRVCSNFLIVHTGEIFKVNVIES